MFFLKRLHFNKIKYNGKTNRVIIHTVDGRIITNPRYVRRYRIVFHGQNATIEIFEPCVLNGSLFVLYDGDYFTIKKTVGEIFVIGGALCSGHTRLFIDEGCSLNNTKFYMNSRPNTFIELGRDCMFSFDVSIWASDTHQIINNKTKQVVNNEVHGVSIGDHVWCGTRVTILKGTHIANNSVIGAASVVSGKFVEPNIVIAGNVAKKIKSNIDWLREPLPE
ncbi:MAG: acyltransferase [Alphaproteobacteria bacterium]|nr:acyltransferase [Alphaproteobacteria bacterium]